MKKSLEILVYIFPTSTALSVDFEILDVLKNLKITVKKGPVSIS